jgi:uncharacterized membrane protein YgaE (UPF0421/DUF939 family)
MPGGHSVAARVQDSVKTRKIVGLFVVIGMAIGGFLAWYAYYSNSHREATRINEFVYLLLFPPSIGLMVTENATVPGQVIIVSIVVLANGALYGLVYLVLREMFGSAKK